MASRETDAAASPSKKKQSHWPLSVLGGLTSILNAFLPLSLVRVLTPDEIGQYKVFFLYVAMAPLVTVGLSNGLFFWTGNREKRLTAFRSSWSIIFGVATVLLALSSIFHGPVTHWLGWTSTQVWLFFWACFVTVVSSFYEDANIAMGQIWRGALFSSGFEATRNILIMACALHFRTVDSVMWSYTSIMTAKTLLGWAMGRVEGFQKLQWDRAVWGPVIRYGFPVSVAGLLAMLAAYGDQLLLSGVLPAAQFAIYALGCLAVPPLVIFEMSVNRVLIPNLSLAFNEHKPLRAQTLYRESISELGWLLIPSAVALSLFAKPIVLLLFREKYIEAAPYLQIFAFSYLTFMLPYDAVARARGLGTWVLRILLVFAPISIAAVYIGARFYGAMGALIAVMIFRFLMRFGAIAWISKTEKWKLSDMLPLGDLARYGLVSGAAAAAATVVGIWVRHPLHWLVTGGAVFSLVYLGATLAEYLRRRSSHVAAPTVLLLTQRLELDVQGRDLLALARGLADTGRWTPVVYFCGPASSTSALRDELARSGIQVIDRSRSGLLTVPLILRLLNCVLRQKVAIAHSQEPRTLTYALALKWLTLGALKTTHSPQGAAQPDAFGIAGAQS